MSIYICIRFRLAMVYTSAGADIKRIILRALENPVSESYRIPYFIDKFIALWSCMGQELSGTYWYLKFCSIGEKIFICKCSVSTRYNLYGHILCSCTCAWIWKNKCTRWLDPPCISSFVLQVVVEGSVLKPVLLYVGKRYGDEVSRAVDARRKLS